MVDKKGHSDLSNSFEKLKTAEPGRLKHCYKEKLKDYQSEGIIGLHTVSEFEVWMGQQDLAGKYEAEEKLPNQMARYEELWQEIKELPKKQQNFLRSKIDAWGYTELDDQYNKFIAGEDIPVTSSDSGDQNLSQLRSKEVKDAIIETDDMLSEQGTGKKNSFIRVLDKMFNRVNRDSFDASSFETDLRAKVANDNGVKHIKKNRGADDEVNKKQIDNDTKILEESGKAKVSEESGFIQVESAVGNKTARQTQVTINASGGMKRFFNEDSKHNYRAEDDGGHDDLSLAIYTDAGRTVELDLQEIRVLHKHMEAQEEEDSLDKAD